MSIIGGGSAVCEGANRRGGGQGGEKESLNIRLVRRLYSGYQISVRVYI